ncbi:MAG: class I SAM-dependent rRNA methyltransferase [Bacteroidota bacterium]|jgi:23S rRNA (cytosine1962-C5)-methyltransferase
MLTLTLKPREERRLRDGHLWAYRDELVHAPDAVPGELVRLLAHDGSSLGTGFYNPLSKIAVRLLGGEVEVADADFFYRRFTSSKALRERFLGREEAYRLVFGEADMLSGLIVDVYGQTIVIQMLSAGMDRRKADIVDALRRLYPDVSGIIEKNTAQTRVKEGLTLVDAVVWGEVPDAVIVHENGLKLELHLLTGQKTGYFLDQKFNRRIVGSLSRDRKVLDCFCNVGGFALNAAQGHAAMAVGVDSSESAINSATRHAEINGLDNCQFVKANVFDLLREHIEQERVWDMVILDPPSFAKSRSAIRGALAGYSELNRSAMKLLRPGGLLVSSSCTQLVSEHDLLDILYRESARIRKRLRLVHRGSQAPDHPVLLSMPETQYLKFLVFEVIGDP